MIMLQGPRDSLGQYLRLHRTTSVDVDSKGRQCKEHMMTVLVREMADTMARELAVGVGREEDVLTVLV